MAILRASMIFGYFTERRGRPAGMSESWYLNSDPTAAMAALKVLCQKRMGMAPQSVFIHGQRVQVLEPAGRSVTDNEEFLGARVAATQDVPQVALQCVVKNAANTLAKSFSMRMMPDAVFKGGDYTPGEVAGFAAAVTAFGTALAAGSWQWRARRTSNPRAKIVSIAADGTFVLEPGITFDQWKSLTLMRVVNTAGKSVVGNFVVSVKTDNQNGKFANWGGSTVQGKGAVRLLEYDYPIVAPGSFKVVQAMIRKVGRPSNLYRGRATARR